MDNEVRKNEIVIISKQIIRDLNHNTQSHNLSQLENNYISSCKEILELSNKLQKYKIEYENLK